MKSSVRISIMNGENIVDITSLCSRPLINVPFYFPSSFLRKKKRKIKKHGLPDKFERVPSYPEVIEALEFFVE